MTLTLAPLHEPFCIQRITGKDEIRKHLATLGFVEGANVSVVNERNGNVIINIKNTRIALDKTLSNRILVSKGKGELI